MAHHTVSWALHQEIKPVLKIMLIAIANYTNESDESFTSIKKIADMAQISRSSVKRNLTKLVKYKLLSIKRRTRKDGGYSSSLYVLDLSIFIKNEIGGKVQNELRVGSKVGVPELRVGSKVGVPEPSLSSSNNKTLTSNSNGHPNAKKADDRIFHLDKSFNKAWNLYFPKYKIGKQEAKASYKKSVKDIKNEDLFLFALENYKKFLSTEDWQNPVQGKKFFKAIVWMDWAEYEFIEPGIAMDKETKQKFLIKAIDKFKTLRELYKEKTPPIEWQNQHGYKTYVDSFLLRSMVDNMGYRRDILQMLVDEFGLKNLTGNFKQNGKE